MQPLSTLPAEYSAANLGRRVNVAVAVAISEIRWSDPPIPAAKPRSD